MYEPRDLEDMPQSSGVDAVIQDVTDHPAHPGSDGLFTAWRHIDLLGELTRRLSGDIHVHIEFPRTEPAVHPVEAQAEAAAQAINPATLPSAERRARLSFHPPATTAEKIDALDQHSVLRRYLGLVQETPAEARAALTGAARPPHQPDASSVPTPPVAPTRTRTRRP